MSFKVVAALVLGCTLLSAAATGIVLWWLRRREILDHPNERSSHDLPTPRGGGLAVVPVVAIAWTIITVLGMAPWQTLAPVGGAVGLAYIGWRDDRGGLSIVYRLAAQFAAVGVGVVCLPGAGHVFQGLLPPWADMIATAVAWVWFVNLFNFMDGIDGITGAETLALGIGVALVAAMSADYETGGVPLGLALAAAAAGFLPWNWQPARLFLGDVGSVPLGLLGGWLLLGLAGRGLWAPALILPLYYLTDATLTLLHRALRGRLVWQAHKEHAYQRAVQLGRAHAGVVLRVFAADAGLVLLALVAVSWPWAGLVPAVVLVALLIVHLLLPPAAAAPLPDEPA